MKSTQRIGFILAVVFLMPALFFSVYEISSLNKDEKMIQEIYTKQLEAILFSVNQYSDDLVSSWISKTESGLQEPMPGDSMPSRIKDLLTFNSSIAALFVRDTVDGKSVNMIFSLDSSFIELVKDKSNAALISNKNKTRQLISYKRSGFQKVDMLSYVWNEQEDLQCLAFITEDHRENFLIAGVLVNPETFIENFIGPRLQVIAKDQFILSAFNKAVTAPIYSTLSSDTITMKAEALTKDFWLFPNYTLGIRAKGSSLQQLISERTTTNLVLLLSLDVILIIAVVLVFRNVKKEVQLAQNKADFVSNVSHEIRTPLALISMFAETLEMGRVKSEEKKQEYYRIISKETNRLTGIVNKILNFSQTEANKKRLHIEVFHAGNEIKEILNTYEFHLTSKGFTYALSDEAEIEIKADREAFVEALINLIDNAIKYSTDKKHIEIKTGIENSFGTISVKDQGIGISKVNQKHIFDKFYRVSSGNLAQSKGTGLGLSLVKQLMDAQQGKVTVSSETGQGSLFTLYFPLEAR